MSHKFTVSWQGIIDAICLCIQPCLSTFTYSHGRLQIIHEIESDPGRYRDFRGWGKTGVMRMTGVTDSAFRRIDPRSDRKKRRTLKAEPIHAIAVGIAF